MNDLHQSGDMAVERWPAFREGAAAAGARALFALPLRIAGISVRALDLYRDQPGTLTTGQFSAALMAAEAAAATILQLGTGTAVVSANIEADHARWPLFASSALAAGFRSVVALPMRLRDQTIGGLNLFDDRAILVPQEDQQLAQALADVATIGILQQRSAQRSAMLAEHLQRALNSRVVIEQAKGILAERNGLSMVAAFDSLRTYAREKNMKLTDLAQAIVHDDDNLAWPTGR